MTDTTTTSTTTVAAAAAGGAATPPPPPQPATSSPVQVAEICLDLLLAETERHFMHRDVQNANTSSSDDAKHLQAIGYRVGYALVERCSRGKPRPTDKLDAVKFVCKDFWSVAFGKNVDHLRTNHRGVFVLQDTSFRNLRHVPQHANNDVANERLQIPTGMLQGALAALGVPPTSVEVECNSPPDVTFTVKIGVAP
ncbi:trafficking protein particle complex subunit 6 [Pseudoscourfieldia marina]